MKTTPLRILAEQLVEASKVLISIEHTVSALGALNGNGYSNEKPVKVRPYDRILPRHYVRRAKPRPKTDKPKALQPAATRKAKRHAKSKLSARQKSALQLTGRYAGYVRNLTSEQRERVGLVRDRKGYPHAIALAKSLNEQRMKRLGVSVAAAAAPASK